MQVWSSLAAMQAARPTLAGPLGFVPTMGNLHAGHLSLIELARQQSASVVASIYVNPMQFDRPDDFSQYPRSFDADLAALREAGVDGVFLPTDQDLYPDGIAASTRVEVPHIANVLCGASRPGHFLGVSTVVTKLFGMLRPDLAVFGSKDFQQLMIVRRMVSDLHLPVQILAAPTAREVSGLAMSSRNQHLSAQERRQATVLYAQLQALVSALRAGRTDYAALCEQAQRAVRAAGLRPDYLEIRRSHDLSEPDADSGVESPSALGVFVAAFAGDTRLIDNLQVADGQD